MMYALPRAARESRSTKIFSGRLVAEPSVLSHGSDTVAQEGLNGRPDRGFWAAGQQRGRSLIRQDLGFSPLAVIRARTHTGLLLQRLAEPGRLSFFAAHCSGLPDAGDWAGCYVTVTDVKLRAHRPGRSLLIGVRRRGTPRLQRIGVTRISVAGKGSSPFPPTPWQPGWAP